MKNRTRLFMLVAVGILVLGLGTGLVAYMGGLQNLVAIGADGPRELEYVAPNTRMVAYANVRDIMNSELRQKIRALQPGADSAQDQFQAQTGIDIEHDIDHVLATLSDTESDQDRPLVFARGQFDASRIENLIQQHGATAEDYKGIRLLSQPEARMSVAFLESDLVAVGSPAAVRRAIDTKISGSGSIRDNAELMSLVRDIETGNAWAVATFEALTAGRHLPPEIVQQLPPINWFAVTGQVNGGIHGVLRAEARDDASAQSLREVVRGFVALARLQGGQHEQVAELVNSLELTGQGKTVSLAFSVPSQMIGALGAMHAGKQRDPRPSPEAAPVRPESPKIPSPSL